MAKWLPGAAKVARCGSQELPRWPGGTRSRMEGVWVGQVAARSCQGGKGALGIGWRGSGVARWLPRWPGGARSRMEGAWGGQVAAKVARGCQESDGEGLGWPGGWQELPRWPGGARSRSEGVWGGQVAARSFQGGQGAPGVRRRARGRQELYGKNTLLILVT